jgi:hypothetical protein
MSTIAEAVEKFRKERLSVYRAQRSQLQRDVGVVNETVKDHIGRWPLELIQNCDDAEAQRVLILVTSSAVYIADSGCGLRPDAVESLSGTHFSTKPVGAIGRKGLGFKAVYEITSTPAVFTGADDGVVFCPDMAREELSRELGINSVNRVPHEWLPFWISRCKAARLDPVIAELAGWATVVRLPLDKPAVKLLDALAVLRGLPSQALLTFRHVQWLQVAGDRSERLITRELKTGATDTWTVSDSIVGGPVDWRIHRVCMRVPEEHLRGLEESDRVRMGEVSLLVAAPVDTSGFVVPAHDFPKICVYYPIGENEEDGRAPVRLLLHADFLVSSDRKQLLPFETYPLNSWLADRLADETVTFVDGSYRPDEPAAHLRLLLSHKELEAHPLAAEVWERIKGNARNRLLLPDAMGNRRLTLAEARFVATSVAAEEARSILQGETQSTRLVHISVEQDEQARQVLRKLGCDDIKDSDIVECIARVASTATVDRDWLWSCWVWLANWTAKEHSYTNEHKRRVKEIKSLQILPITALSRNPADLSDHTVITWRDQEQTDDLPEWLPIRFVDDWFRDRLIELDNEDPVRKIAQELGIKEPDSALVLRAFGLAVDQYWKEPSADPERFAAFLLSHEWHVRIDPSDQVRRCPIHVDIENGPCGIWREAHQAYFGQEWGNSLVADLYQGIEGIVWAKVDERAGESHRALLEWLGVVAHPRVIEDPRSEAAESERQRVRPLVHYETVLEARNLRLDGIDVANLTPTKRTTLLRLVAKNWTNYYEARRKSRVSHTPRSRTYFTEVDARWWDDLKSAVIPSQQSRHTEVSTLERCWLPDRETRRAVGDLLPIIDLDQFEGDRPVVEAWLRQLVGLRTHLSQIKPEEWQKLLTERVPKIIGAVGPDDNDKRQMVQRWYVAALDSLADQKSSSPLTGVPLLCRKGEVWEFRNAAEQRWLADSAELADAFRSDLWIIEIPGRLHKHGERYFGLQSLDRSVEETRCFDTSDASDCPELQKLLEGVKPFIFAWRRYRTRQNPDELRRLLSSLLVRQLPGLQIALKLPGQSGSRILSRPFCHDGDVLFLVAETANVMMLAGALARALDLRSADFFENLLRCHDDSERKAKLRTENIPHDQIDLSLREFSHMPGRAGTLTGEGLPTPSAEPITPPSEEGKKQSFVPLESGETQGSGGGDQTRRATRHEPQGKTLDQLRPPSGPEGAMRLKDASTVLYILQANLPKPADGLENDGPKGMRPDGQKGDDQRADTPNGLTQQEKDEIEVHGRTVAKRELEKQGYSVEWMPMENRGFDLRATKDQEVLLVEVKGHRGASYIAQVTEAQVKECDRCAEPGNHEMWHLWNVEHLAVADPHEVTITIIRRIPPEARRADRYRVDLRKCEIERQTGVAG